MVSSVRIIKGVGFQNRFLLMRKKAFEELLDCSKGNDVRKKNFFKKIFNAR